jgi:hypothetical protein
MVIFKKKHCDMAKSAPHQNNNGNAEKSTDGWRAAQSVGGRDAADAEGLRTISGE